jgi:hypothetical protein
MKEITWARPRIWLSLAKEGKTPEEKCKLMRK